MTHIEYRPDECEWFPLCENPAVGQAVHGIHGVIGVCQVHVDLYAIPLIKPRSPESE